MRALTMKTQSLQSNKQQQGFTLIELVIVIVILGILAATAAPKFIDLTGDAKASARKGVEGAVKGALALGHAKALIAGVSDGEVSINGSFVKMAKGYPSTKADATADGTTGKAYNIYFLLDIDGDMTTQSKTTTGADLTISVAADCTVTLTDSTVANISPVPAGTTTCS